MKRIASLVFLSITIAVCHAQNLFVPNNTIPVFDGPRQLAYPWAGGLNNPQFAAADLNNDGIDDLVVLNRGSVGEGHFLLTFINGGTPNQVDYTYAPQYVADLPNMTQWMLSMDYNCDGVPDFVTWEAPSLMILYKGVRLANGRLSYPTKDTLFFTSSTGTVTNVGVTAIDIPAMVDVNNDGDIDILTFSLVGLRMEYFENLSVETNNGCGDTTGFAIKSYCWGEFEETGATPSPDLFRPCGPPKTEEIIDGSNRHAGSSVLGYDKNGNGLIDLILGDITYNNLVELTNGGTQDSAVAVSKDSTFPAYSVPVEMPVFPASFYLDVDNDGRKDLIVAPNTPKKGLNYNCAWWYKDVSTNANVDFELQTDTFMVRDMIDVGEGAYPAFVDINGDGLLDMVVGNNGYYFDNTRATSGLALFINVGTASAPAFRLIDRDYMNFSTFQTGSVTLRSLAPAFADMNGDGAMDMIVGDHEGYLHYFRNTAPAGDSMRLQLEAHQFKNIDVGTFAKPEIFDVNGDGLPDLIVGRSFGTLHYFENVGTATNPDFNTVPTNSAFGQVNVKSDFLPNGESTPRVVYLTHTNQPYLVIGNIVGNIAVYELDASKRYNGTFNKLFTYYSHINVGEFAHLAIADLDGDGKWEMAVGSLRGGVNFYKETNEKFVGIAHTPTTPALGIKAFPNPAAGNWQIAVDGLTQNETMEVTVYDVLGQQVYRTTHTPQNSQAQLPVQFNASPGIYFCRVTQGSRTAVLRLLAQ